MSNASIYNRSRNYTADSAPDYLLNDWGLGPDIVRRHDLLPAFDLAFAEAGQASDVAGAAVVEIANCLLRVMQMPGRCRCIACDHVFQRGEKPDAFLVGAIDRLRAWPLCSACEAQRDAVTVQKADATLARE